MDESTTDAVVQEQAATQPQPEGQPAEAEQTPTSEPTSSTPDEQSDTTQEPATPENSEEELDPVAYWAKKDIDITTPEGLAKATKSYRESIGKMYESNRRSNELEKQLNTTEFQQVSADPAIQQALDKANAVELAYKVDSWKRDNNITPDQDVAIGNYLAENSDKAWLLKNDHLTLDDIAAMSGVLKQDTTAIKAAGGKEALEQLANKQRTTAVKGGATTPSLPDQKVDNIMEGLLADD